MSVLRTDHQGRGEFLWTPKANAFGWTAYLGHPPRADDAPASQAMAKLEQPKATGKDDGDKKLSGMSILGNQEAPKSLVIVPWKSSEIGDARGITDSLDDSRRPVDKEVFMRELKYYEIREGAE
jgi:hypothetical protein